MGRLEAPLFEVWLRLRASRAPSGAQIAALQRAKSPVETKFDLQKPFLSGLGSTCGFFGFLGGHGVKNKSAWIGQVMTRIFP